MELKKYLPLYPRRDVNHDNGSIYNPLLPISNVGIIDSVTRLGDLGSFLKPLATIRLPKSPTFLGNFCKGVYFSIEIIFGQLL